MNKGDLFSQLHLKIFPFIFVLPILKSAVQFIKQQIVLIYATTIVVKRHFEWDLHFFLQKSDFVKLYAKNCLNST